MSNLKIDFYNRFKNNSHNIVFRSLSGKSYSAEICQFYFFFVYKQIKDLESPVALFCNSSLESHIISFFLILSPAKVFLLSNSSNPEQIQKILGNQRIKSILKFSNSELSSVYSNLPNDIKTIDIISIEDFIKWTNPSFDINLVSEEYHLNNKIGDSIFMSSGSTGEPKLIPLNYKAINACYLNIIDGFINEISYEKILSVHDTSFVIVLPFLFFFSFNINSCLIASDYKYCSIPIIQLCNNLKYLFTNNFLFISVPSIYKMIINSLKDRSIKFFQSQSLITCGEPLDKQLASKIFSYSPRSFFNLYGSTEVAPWIISLNVKEYMLSNQDNNDPILPAGKALPNVNLIISKNKELLVNTKSVFSGYLKTDNTSYFEQINNNHYFRTGDSFELKNDYYFCKGRMNSAIKVAGVFINPMILEAAIKYNLKLENILIIPFISRSSILIVLFTNNDADKSASIKTKIKEIIYKNISAKIPLKFIIKENEIRFLRSGKVDRKYYIDELTKTND